MNAEPPLPDPPAGVIVLERPLDARLALLAESVADRSEHLEAALPGRVVLVIGGSREVERQLEALVCEGLEVRDP